MFNGIKAVLLTALILFASAGSTEAASLGINFLGDGEEGTDAWNSDGFSDTPDEKPMKGILKNYPGSSMVLTVTNLDPAFYDVYLYGNVKFFRLRSG
jgi:hypothetical protein